MEDSYRHKGMRRALVKILQGKGVGGTLTAEMS